MAKRKSSVAAFVLLGAAIVLFAAGAGLSRLYSKNYEKLQEMLSAVNKEGFYSGITVNGKDVAGRSYEEVLSELQAEQQAEAEQRTITVNENGQTTTLHANSSYNTEEVLAEAYNYAKEGELQERYDKIKALETQPIDFVPECTVTMEGIDELVNSLAANVTEPVDATVISFDPETHSFTFSDEVNGFYIDAEALRSQLNQIVENGSYPAEVPVQIVETPAAVTRAQLESEYKLLSSFTTKATSSSSRNTNIKLALASFNGHVVQPGETFSINDCTGKRTKEKGYKDAGSIQNGILIEEPGGGVCQVSSTLFNAVIRSGCAEIVERHGHTWPSDYVSIGMDAAIDYPAKDFKFTNTSDFPIFLVSSFNDNSHELTVEVYGRSSLEEGVTIDLRSTTDGTIKRGDDIRQYDASLKAGTTTTVRKGRDGKKSTTYIQYLKDGKVVEEKVLFTTTYPAVRKIIAYGPNVPETPVTPTEPEEPIFVPEENTTNVWP